MSDIGWYGRTWYDRKQNSRLDSLSSQLSSQRGEARRLTAQLSQVQGDLSQRLGRLTTAFDAFVELSDIREELRAFQPAVAMRSEARRYLGRLLAHDGDADHAATPPLAAGADSGIADYWLPFALAALVAMVTADDAAAPTLLAQARERDTLRTDLFLCLSLRLTKRTEPAAGLLPGVLLFRPDEQVTQAQRQLWAAASAGVFGEGGRSAVAEQLAALVRGLPDDVRATTVTTWRDTLVDQVSVDLPAFPRNVDPPAELVTPVRAARQLAALADRCRDATSTDAATTSPDGDDDGDDDALYDLLRDLVDEGAPLEEPLLIRAVELRRVIQADSGGGAGESESTAPPTRWDAEAGTPLALLLADVEATEADRRALAFQAAAPLMTAIGAELAATATQVPPDAVEIEISRHRIRFGSLGVDRASVDAARAAALAGAPSPPANDPVTTIGWGLVAASALILLAGLIAGAPAVGVTLAALAAGIGGWLVFHAYQVRQHAESSRRYAETRWAELEQLIAQVESAVADLRAAGRNAAEDSHASRSRLDDHLG